jgi:hypothetical protein
MCCREEYNIALTGTRGEVWPRGKRNFLETDSELLGFGLRPSSDIKKSRGHNVSETGSLSILR